MVTLLTCGDHAPGACLPVLTSLLFLPVGPPPPCLLPAPHPRRLYALATFVALAAVALAVGVTNIENKDTAGIVTMAVAAIVATAVYMVRARQPGRQAGG